MCKFCYDLSLSVTTVWVQCPLALSSILTLQTRLNKISNFFLAETAEQFLLAPGKAQVSDSCSTEIQPY